MVVRFVKRRSEEMDGVGKRTIGPPRLAFSVVSRILLSDVLGGRQSRSLLRFFIAAVVSTTGLWFADWSSPVLQLEQEKHSTAYTDEGSGQWDTYSGSRTHRPDSCPVYRKTALTVGPGRWKHGAFEGWWTVVDEGKLGPVWCSQSTRAAGSE